MMPCDYCGRPVKRRQTVHTHAVMTTARELAGILLAQEVLQTHEGLDSESTQEMSRLCRNGAGMARQLHDAAHRDQRGVPNLPALLEAWMMLGMDLVKQAMEVDPAGWQAALLRREAAGDRARWMIDNVVINQQGEALLPTD